MQSKTYLSDILTPQEVFQHCETDIPQFIFARTGYGKTVFLFEKLIPYYIEQGKKVLYLCNRITLRAELYEKYSSMQSKLFSIKSYQALERHIINDEYNAVFEEDYDLVISDEAHYFVVDSNMNDNTFLSFEWVYSQNHKLFVTATPIPLYYLSEWYFQDPTKFNVIHNSTANDSDKFEPEAVRQIIFTENEIETREVIDKVLSKGRQVFISANNTEKILEYHNHYDGIIIDGEEKSSSFLCSKANAKAKLITKGVEEQISQGIVPTDVIAATPVLSDGVSLNSFIGAIVGIGTQSMTQLEQTAGRARYDEKYKDEETQVVLVVEVPHAISFHRKLQTIEEELLFLDVDFNEWKKVTGRKKSPAYVWEEFAGNDEDGTPLYKHKINPMKVALMKMDRIDYKRIASSGRGETIKKYKQTVLSCFPSAKEISYGSYLLDGQKFDIRDYQDKVLIKEEIENIKDILSIEFRRKVTTPFFKKYLKSYGYELMTKIQRIDGIPTNTWTIRKV